MNAEDRFFARATRRRALRMPGFVISLLQPLKHLAAVDGDCMCGIAHRCRGVEGFKESFQNLVGTLVLISRRAIKIDLEHTPAFKRSFTQTLLGRDEFATDGSRKVLQKRRLAIASISKQHDQINFPGLNVPLKCAIQPSFHIGLY